MATDIVSKSIKGTNYTVYFLKTIKERHHPTKSYSWIFRNAFADFASDIKMSDKDCTNINEQIIEAWKYEYTFPKRYPDIENKTTNKSFKISYVANDMFIISSSFNKFCDIFHMDTDISSIKLADMVLVYYLEKWDYMNGKSVENLKYSFRRVTEDTPKLTPLNLKSKAIKYKGVQGLRETYGDPIINDLKSLMERATKIENEVVLLITDIDKLAKRIESEDKHE